jgi:hypothetical protein
MGETSRSNPVTMTMSRLVRPARPCTKASTSQKRALLRSGGFRLTMLSPARGHDGSGSPPTMCSPCASTTMRERQLHRPHPDAERCEGPWSGSVFSRRNHVFHSHERRQSATSSNTTTAAPAPATVAARTTKGLAALFKAPGEERPPPAAVQRSELFDPSIGK